MVICQYYLKGMCKFGDRCRNEHRKPDNRGSNQQGNYDRYNQGNRNNQNYDQDRRGGGQGRRGGGDQGYDDDYNQGYNQKGGGGQHRHGGGGQHHHDDGDQGYDDHYNQDYHNQNYDQDRKGSGGQGRYGGNEGVNDGYRGGGNYKNDKYHYDARNTGNSNRFTALSHQPDPEMPNFDQKSQSRGRTYSSTSQHSATPDIERVVKKGIQECNEGGQWPFSCFSPLTNDVCLHGLVDISPEEVRVEAYKANSEGNSQNYVQSLQQTLEKYDCRKRELVSMSSSSLQQEMSKSSQPNNATSPAGLFGGVASSLSTFGGNQPSLFGNTQTAAPTSSAELFGSGTQSSSGSGPFTSTPFVSSSKQVAFGSTFPATNSPGGLFGETSPGTAQYSQPETSKEHPNISEVHTMTSDTRQPVVPLLKCSEQDIKAFKANHFVLGAIPECPPPLELC